MVQARDQPRSSPRPSCVWYLLTDDVPGDFVGATPYVMTLLVLALSAQRLRMPKADGMRYRKGQGK